MRRQKARGGRKHGRLGQSPACPCRVAGGLAQRGFSLIETTVVLSITTVLAGIAVGVVSLLFRAEEALRAEAVQSLHASRLAQRFRNDVHAAVRLRAVPPADGSAPAHAWDLLGPEAPSGRVVQYRLAPNQVSRLVFSGNDVIQREAFAVPGRAAFSLESASDSLSVVRLRIVADGGQANRGVAWPLCVEAVLGSDHRFNQQK